MLVTAIATHPEVAPSTRFRIHQFREPLGRRGIRVQYEFLFGAEEYRRLRSGQSVWGRARDLVGATRRRLRALRTRGLGDVVWVSRDLGPLGSGVVLSALRERGVPLVSDFDDAVFLAPEGGSPWLAPLRRPRTAFEALCGASTVVLAGSRYLATAAHQAAGAGRPDVRILPTVVDTERFRPSQDRLRPWGATALPVLGWVGSHSTMPYLWGLQGALEALARRIPFTLRVVSDVPPPPFPGLDVDFLRWTPQSEVAAFHGLDVGLYPLPDDPWTRGKCGFKAIQYGACGIPVVCSPVGVLRDIVVPEETGLWAESDDDWVRTLERLLRTPDQAEAMGRTGRDWITARYSVTSALPDLEAAFRDAAEGREGSGPPFYDTLERSHPTEEGLCAASPVT